MRTLTKKWSVLRKAAIAFLAAIVAVCAGMFVISLNNKKAEAVSAWGSLVINPGTNPAYYQYSSDGGAMLQVSDQGAIINFELVPTDFSQYNYVDISFSPSNAMLWASQDQAGNLYFTNNETQGSGRFFIRLRTNTFNGDNYGLGMWMLLPNGSTGISSGYQLVTNDIWTGGAGTVFNICIRIVQINGKWDILINDLDLNALGNSVAATYPQYADFFDTYVGGAFKNGNQMDFAIINPQGAPSRYYLGLGEMRGLTAQEVADINDPNSKFVTAYSPSLASYGSRTSSLMQLNRFGGYVDYRFDVLNKPWEGYAPEIAIAFSPDGNLVLNSEGEGIMGADSGRFYLKFRILNTGIAGGNICQLSVAAHFAAGQPDGWLLMDGNLTGGVKTIRFMFKSNGGGWSFIMQYGDNLFYFDEDYVADGVTITGFRKGVSQTAVMSSYQLDTGAYGNCFYKCNYANVYFGGYGAYNGYAVKTNRDALMELLIGSPSLRVSYYDDATASGGSYIDIPANTAFDVNLAVMLGAPITSQQTFQVAFGPNTIVMNSDPNQQDTGNNHFMVVISLNTDGIIRAQILYNAGSGHACDPINQLEYGSVGAFANQAGTFNIVISIRKVNAATANNLWGLYVNGQLLDTINFDYIIHRAGANAGFMETANKNIALTVNSYNGFGVFPGNIYLMSINQAASPATGAATVASVADLKSKAGVDLFTDSVTINGNTAYYYNVTSATQTNDVIFRTNFTYKDGVNYTFRLRSVTDGEKDVPAFVLMNGAILIGSVTSNQSVNAESAYITRSCPLTDGTVYEFSFSTLTLTDDNTKILMSIKVAEASTGTAKAAGEALYTLSGTANYGVVIATSASTVFSSVTHRVKFVDRTGAAVSAERYNHGENGKGAPTAASVPYYTFKAWENRNSGNAAYVAGSPINVTAVYTATYNLDGSAITAEINTRQTKYNPVCQVWLKNDKVSSALIFVNNVSNSLINFLEQQVDNDYIQSYKVGTLVTSSNLNASQFTVTASNVHKIESTAYFLNDATQDANVKYVACGISNLPQNLYATTITSRIYIEVTLTDGEVVYFYGALNGGSFNSSVSYALNEDAAYYSVSQRTALSALVG